MEQMQKMIKLLALFFLMPLPLSAHQHMATTSTATSTEIALGYLTGNGSYIADPTLFERFTKAAPDWVIALVPMLIAAMFIFRGLAEVLLWVSKRTASKGDDKAYEILSVASYWMARVLSWVGVGVPKILLVEKAEALNTKQTEGAKQNEPAITKPSGSDIKDGPSVN